MAWYDTHRRSLPWRTLPGEVPDPYRVWLSEIMLQQTTVAAVTARYREFLGRWPDLPSLAAASLDEIRAAWAGLGYYSRARNLHRTAQILVHERGGQFPCDARQLRELPGIGSYTAGAIAAIAFNACEAAIDANAERVLSRFFALTVPLATIKKRLHELAQSLIPSSRPGDFAQALMDLGASICTAKRPDCARCPLNSACQGHLSGIAESLPRKGADRERPLKRGAAFVARDREGAVLLVKRPEKGLLGGMLQPPLGPWAEAFPAIALARAQAPFRAAWKKRTGSVRHGFTHFMLEVEVYATTVEQHPRVDGRWVAAEDLGHSALPTVMRKIVAYAFDEPGPLFARKVP
jgi:A/G-specific adenine glycosylase